MATTATTEAHKASRPFWISGGELAGAAAAACPHAPAHRWWTFRLEDALAPEWFAAQEDLVLPSDELTICRGCLVVRCSAYDGEERCVRPKDHPETFHRFAHRPAVAVRG